MTEQYIQSIGNLRQHFCNRGEEVFVTGKIRKEFLTDIDQGKIVVNGTVKRVVFDNMGGGVYKARLEKLQKG